MIYIDANVFVFASFDDTEKGRTARKAIEEIGEGKLPLAITSTLTMDEVMWAAIKNKKTAELRATVEDIYAMPNLVIKGVNSNIPLMALSFIEEQGLKPRDAFHAAIMKSFGITEIVSDDSDFDKVKWMKRIKL